MDNTDFAEVVRKQYAAALKMLRNAIEKCPDDVWDHRDPGEATFWGHAMHALFYTRTYLQDSLGGSDDVENRTVAMELLGLPLKDFSQPETQRLAQTMWRITQHDFRTPRVPTKTELLERLDKCQTALATAMSQAAAGGADGPSPMPWIPGTRWDLLLYNLRHIPQHLGRMHSTLGRRGIKLEWVGGL
jgi:hypothetical protein